ncbi:IS3 family transposase [Aureibaculum marinum]|nr:IS3 family transposase [Aureibaculum marinum]
MIINNNTLYNLLSIQLADRYAMVKRVNGILKDEVYLNQTFDNVAYAKRATKNAINLYNQIRLHLYLDFKTHKMVYKLSA